MITELRRYSVVPGRMDEMHARMTDLLLPLFAEMKLPLPSAIWDSRGRSCVFTWMIEWESFDARSEGWARYNPQFYAARMKQEIDEFVTRTDVTLINAWPDQPIIFPPGAGLCETLWIAQPVVLHGANFRIACLDDESALFREAGVTSVQGCDFAFGALPQAAVFLSWPDAGTREAGMVKLAKQAVPEVLGRALGGAASICEHGIWEPLDRAVYLPGWKGG